MQIKSMLIINYERILVFKFSIVCNQFFCKYYLTTFIYCMGYTFFLVLK